ncbi:MAG: hypothetical protein ACXVJT_09130, partial [Thermoanaerobaculia bacterium]
LRVHDEGAALGRLALVHGRSVLELLESRGALPIGFRRIERDDGTGDRLPIIRNERPMNAGCTGRRRNAEQQGD